MKISHTFVFMILVKHKFYWYQIQLFEIYIVLAMKEIWKGEK
jgi:hypothetical protein